MNNTIFSLTIRNADWTKEFVKPFSSEEDRQAYIKSEFKFTYKELKNLWQAISKEDRIAAKDALYISRMNHMKYFDSKDVQPELA